MDGPTNVGSLKSPYIKCVVNEKESHAITMGRKASFIARPFERRAEWKDSSSFLYRSVSVTIVMNNFYTRTWSRRKLILPIRTWASKALATTLNCSQNLFRLVSIRNWLRHLESYHIHFKPFVFSISFNFHVLVATSSFQFVCPSAAISIILFLNSFVSFLCRSAQSLLTTVLYQL